MASGKRILLLVPEEEEARFRALEEESFVLTFSQNATVLEALSPEETPDLLLVDLGLLPQEGHGAFLQQCKGFRLPVLAVVPPALQATTDPTLPAEDLIYAPVQLQELVARVKRVLWQSGKWASDHVVRTGDLVIDQERYEVTVDGRRVMLTYKEYQLLCLLASNPGRVYSREALLSRVWGYDYFGGTRTVDVHIRRLRSKVEDATHLFIETVRNVGYRFSVA